MGSYLLPYGGESTHCRLPSINSLLLDMPNESNRMLPPLFRTLPPPNPTYQMNSSSAYLAPSPFVNSSMSYSREHGSLIGIQPTGSAYPASSEAVSVPGAANVVQAGGGGVAQAAMVPSGVAQGGIAGPVLAGPVAAAASTDYTAQQPPISPITPPTLRHELKRASEAVREGIRSRASSDPYRPPMLPIKTDDDRDFKVLRESSADYEREKLSGSDIETIKDGDARKSHWKPRKKKQCPECRQYFLNLATHKSTHLKPTSRPHVCSYCSRGFARPNDLLRHIKCHWKEIGVDKGQYKCPYKNHSTGDHCCHSSGIFSRCDTFKNHLKAIHFQYPGGTKKDQRNKVSGNCRMCHQYFTNVDNWLNEHIEKGQCPFGNDVKRD